MLYRVSKEDLLHEVCYDVETDSKLNPLTGEKLVLKTANTSDEARVDVSARSFRVRGQKAFFDVRIFNPTAKCYSTQSLNAAHKPNEHVKNAPIMREYRKLNTAHSHH